MKHLLITALAVFSFAVNMPSGFAFAADSELFTHREDVIYGRKYGTALTMDIFTPKKDANGAGIVWVVSGGWFSSHDGISPGNPFSSINELTKRGYTVFAVVHGSQPKFNITEVLQDMNRAVRFIRAHAEEYKIDPNRIGITGASAGGHLSLMQGTAGDLGDPKAKDPIEQVSSRVQAVACFFPPTDFLNYGKPGENAVGKGTLKDFAAPFAFFEVKGVDGRSATFVPILDEEKRAEIGKRVSPITHVTKEDAPTLIIHGDKDFLVPIQQAEIIIEKFKEVGVPAELSVKPGAAHGWADVGPDIQKIANWFDEHLKKKE